MPLRTISDLQAGGVDVLPLIAEAQTIHEQYHNFLARMGDSGPTRSQGIHASEISKCYRQAVYTLRGEDKMFDRGDEDTKAYWKKVFDHGSYVHRMIQDQFTDWAKSTGGSVLFQEEVKVAPELQPIAAKWDIHSSCDGLVTFRNPDGSERLRVGLEIKTKKSSQFDKLKEPEPAHIEQAHVYMAALDVPLFWFVYFNKDNQNITPAEPPWIIQFDSKLWHKLETRFQMFHECFEVGTLPDAMPGMHCGFCPYKWVCKPPAKQSFMSKPTLRRK